MSYLLGDCEWSFPSAKDIILGLLANNQIILIYCQPIQGSFSTHTSTPHCAPWGTISPGVTVPIECTPCVHTRCSPLCATFMPRVLTMLFRASLNHKKAGQKKFIKTKLTKIRHKIK